jgi:hypothetical protein
MIKVLLFIPTLIIKIIVWIFGGGAGDDDDWLGC